MPSELRALARSHQSTLYNLLFQASAQALQTLAKDPRFAGGEIGLIGVLHTWRRDLGFHPHVHFLVPGGALSADHSTWLPAREDFLVPATALSPIFRAKFRDALKRHQTLFQAVPKAAWDKSWVVHLKAVGSGQHALAYLARYVFRVALCNSRLVKLENDQLTFSYREANTQRTRFCTLPALSFIQRFLQHVLPKGFIKVRYYGLFCPAKRKLLAVVRHLLRAATPAPGSSLALALPPRCPTCGALLTLHKTLPPQPRAPPPLRFAPATTLDAAQRPATA
ncbi:MAG: IS91 family transposase [Nitrososphaera sp.]